MKVLGIVPARAGSRRAKRKNVRKIGDKSLVARAIETALGAVTLTDVVVSTDDPKVLEIAAAYPKARALRRPDGLASATSLAIDYVRHALMVLEGEGAGPYDAIVIVQATSPLTTAEDVDETVGVLRRTGYASAVSVTKIEQEIHPLKLKRLDGERLHPYFEDEQGRMAEHELPDVYVRNGSVYVTRRATIDEGKIIADDCGAYVMPRERSVDINDEVDFAVAQLLYQRQQL